jgi:hypothetical protein
LIPDPIIKLPSLSILLICDVLIDSVVLAHVDCASNGNSHSRIVADEGIVNPHVTRKDLASTRRRGAILACVAANYSSNSPIVSPVRQDLELCRNTLDNGRKSG